MSTATARAYQSYFAGRFVPFEMRKSPQNKAFYGHIGTYLGKAHCIKDRVLLDPCVGSGYFLIYAFNNLMKIYEEYGYSECEVADEIFVINFGGYIGTSTRFEIEYAAATGKPLRYLE